MADLLETLTICLWLSIYIVEAKQVLDDGNNFAKPDELLSPTTIASPSNNANVNALLSPVKPTRYFDGELTDGNTVIRVAGFDKAQQQHLLAY